MQQLTVEEARELADLTEQIADNMQRIKEAWEALPAINLNDEREAADDLYGSLRAIGNAYDELPDINLDDETNKAQELVESLRSAAELSND